MNTIVTISAWVLVLLIAISVIGSPFYIGKEREPYSATIYVINLFTILPMIILIGRVLNWW